MVGFGMMLKLVAIDTVHTPLEPISVAVDIPVGVNGGPVLKTLRLLVGSELKTGCPV